MPASPNSRGEQFAQIIRDGRKTKGISQDELARQAGLNRGTIIRYESGDASRPPPDEVRAVCGVLGIDPLRAAMALGYLEPEDLPKPDAGGRKLDPRVMEIIEAFEDPAVPEDDKQRLAEYLQFIRQRRRSGGTGRNAG